MKGILACAAIVSLAPDAAAFRVSSADLQHSADVTRIVLESPRAIRFSLYSLRNPERILLDLDGVEASDALERLAAQMPAHHPYIRRIRSLRASALGMRIELDLNEEVEPRIFTIAPGGGSGYRLILELLPESSLGRDAADTEPTLLAVSINKQPGEAALLLRGADGRLFVSAADLVKWRVRRPAAVPLTKDGESYHPLDSLRGLSYQIDSPTQTLALEAAPGLFEHTSIRGSVATFSTPAPAPLGSFLNYDLFADHAEGRTLPSGLLELGVFGPAGAGVGTFVGRRIDGRFRALRMETTWTRDSPEQLASFRVGDAVSRAASWGRALRFGGVQWSTNFATQPAFIAFPLPGLVGEAVLPSTIDLFVNEALRFRREVPIGPFSIHDLPVITGRGEARLIVRDVLGRERLITQPYYASPRLLQEGLHDYSYEAGFVRENFGVASDDYGRYLAVGTHRLGINDRFTAEVHAEKARGHGALGVGGVYLWPAAGVGSGAVAASRADRGTGGLLALGLEHQSRRLSVGASTVLATRRFSQLGQAADQTAARHASSAFVGWSLDRYGSLTLAYTHQDHRDRDDLRLLSASYGVTLGQLGFVSLSVIHVFGVNEGTSLGLTFTQPLDARTSATASVQQRAGSTRGSAQVQRSLPAGTGFGYRALAGFGDPSRLEGGLTYQNEIGTYSVDAARSGHQTGYRASASGGVAFLAGDTFLSRRITESFAVIDVPGYADVRVYADNQLIGRTSPSGTVLVPRLMPYGRTAVRIDPADLPLEAEIRATQLDAVPYYRSGLFLRFPVKRSRGATFHVVLADGLPLPAGAEVQIAGDDTKFPVGLRGEAYMTGLAEMNRVVASWRDQRCEFDVPFAPTQEPLPHLGRFVCAGVRP